MFDIPLLTQDDETEIISAIEKAEENTSGEIRLHIEKKCPYPDALKRAIELFSSLEMDKTKLKNGVLIYISTKDHKIAIYGDKGINEIVGQDYWNDIIAMIIYRFKHHKYAKGLSEAIHSIGEQLSKLFPYQEDDKNELDNSISYNH